MFDLNNPKTIPSTEASEIRIQQTMRDGNIISAVYRDISINQAIERHRSHLTNCVPVDVFVSINGKKVEVYFEEVPENEANWGDYQIGRHAIKAIRHNATNLDIINKLLKEHGFREILPSDNPFNLLMGGNHINLGEWVVYINGRIEIMSAELFEDLFELPGDVEGDSRVTKYQNGTVCIVTDEAYSHACRMGNVDN